MPADCRTARRALGRRAAVRAGVGGALLALIAAAQRRRRAEWRAPIASAEGLLIAGSGAQSASIGGRKPITSPNCDLANQRRSWAIGGRRMTGIRSWMSLTIR